LNNYKVSALSSSATASVGRREPERSEGDRSATDAVAGFAQDARANPEVVAQAKRRQFTAEYKQRIFGRGRPDQRLRRYRSPVAPRRFVFFAGDDMAPGTRGRSAPGFESTEARFQVPPRSRRAREPAVASVQTERSVKLALTTKLVSTLPWLNSKPHTAGPTISLSWNHCVATTFRLPG